VQHPAVRVLSPPPALSNALPYELRISAPLRSSSSSIVLDGHHRLAALAAEGVSSVAAVRIDRVMRRKPAMLTYDDLIDSRDQPRADRFRRQR